MARFRRIQRSPELQKKLTKLRKGVQPGAQEGLLKAGDIVVAEQQRIAPGDGELKDSISRKLARGTRTGNQAVRISATAFYAAFVEFGTNKHIIRPKNAKALLTGPDRFAASVKHPGTTAQPFFFPGFRAARRRARAAIAKAIRDDIVKAVK